MSPSVKFGVSTWLWVSPFSNKDIREIFDKVAHMGFDALEIAIEDPDIIDPVAVQSAIQEYQLPVIACGAFGPTRDLTMRILASTTIVSGTLKNACLTALPGIQVSWQALCILQSAKPAWCPRNNAWRNGTWP